MMSTNTIHEVMEYGPIVFNDEEMDILITINGAYLNWWNGDHSGNYTCADCRNYEGDLYDTTTAKAMDLAKEWYDCIMTEVA